MPNLIRLERRRFGRLRVLKRAPSKENCVQWRCQCRCGKEKVAASKRLLDGTCRSCGCLKNELSAKRTAKLFWKHGATINGHHRWGYWSWSSMFGRCNNQNNKQWKDYGGRGIRVCKRWKQYKHFLADMGRRPKGLTIDRINNDKGYSKANCRWATRKQQMANRRKRIKTNNQKGRI